MQIILGLACLALYTVCSAENTEMTEAPRNRSVVKVTTVIGEPMLTLNEDYGAGDEPNERFQGFIPDLVKEIFSELDLDYDIQLAKDEKYGMRNPSTGQWNGMIGELERGEADLSAAALSVTPKRESVVNFTVPWKELSLTLLMRQDAPINSLDDLVSQTNYTYGLTAEGATERAFRGSQDPTYSTMWTKIASQYDDVAVRTLAKGVNKTKNEDYAFIMEKPLAEYEANMDCNLKIVDSFLDKKGYAFAVSRKSNVIDTGMIDQRIEAIKASGKMDELYDRWWTKDMCVGASNTPSLSLAVLLAVLLVMISC